MLTPNIDAMGFPIAECTCDVCGYMTTVKAQHTRHRSNEKKKSVVESQVLIKLQAQGWTYIKKTLRCADCETERTQKFTKPKAMESEMANIDTTNDLRQPTREQKRQIMELLNEVYDTKEARYTGGETDKTVAETLGGGVMPGWVAQLREEFFGPDGGNEELAGLSAEMKQLQDRTAEVAKMCREQIDASLSSLREYNKLRDKLAEMAGRIDKLKKAIGPKAENV